MYDKGGDTDEDDVADDDGVAMVCLVRGCMYKCASVRSVCLCCLCIRCRYFCLGRRCWRCVSVVLWVELAVVDGDGEIVGQW